MGASRPLPPNPISSQRLRRYQAMLLHGVNLQHASNVLGEAFLPLRSPARLFWRCLISGECGELLRAMHSFTGYPGDLRQAVPPLLLHIFAAVYMRRSTRLRSVLVCELTCVQAAYICMAVISMPVDLSVAPFLKSKAWGLLYSCFSAILRACLAGAPNPSVPDVWRLIDNFVPTPHNMQASLAEYDTLLRAYNIRFQSMLPELIWLNAPLNVSAALKSAVAVAPPAKIAARPAVLKSLSAAHAPKRLCSARACCKTSPRKCLDAVEDEPPAKRRRASAAASTSAAAAGPVPAAAAAGPVSAAAACSKSSARKWLDAEDEPPARRLRVSDAS